MHDNQGKLEAYDFSVLALNNDTSLEDYSIYMMEVSFDSPSTMKEPHIGLKTFSGSGEWDG